MKDYFEFCGNCIYIDYRQCRNTADNYDYYGSYCKRYHKDLDYYDSDLRLEECIEEFELEVCPKCKGHPVDYLGNSSGDEKPTWVLKSICKVCDCTGFKHNIKYNKEVYEESL